MRLKGGTRLKSNSDEKYNCLACIALKQDHNTKYFLIIFNINVSLLHVA